MLRAGISNWFHLGQVTTVALHSSVQEPLHTQRKHFLALFPTLWLCHSLCLLLQCSLSPLGGEVST